jgi:uncharacterized protein YcfJ
VLGHQVGGGHGRDIATAGGAVAGAAIGANVDGGPRVHDQDVQRCASVEPHARPAYWEVSYRFRGMSRRVRMSAPPGRTISVGEDGVPRG